MHHPADPKTGFWEAQNDGILTDPSHKATEQPRPQMGGRRGSLPHRA